MVWKNKIKYNIKYNMKSINNYIAEKLVINRNIKSPYMYFPETKEELKNIIKQRIEEEGNNCNLNDIDVSEITDMWQLFYNSNFNGNISEWNVSNVEDMRYMFHDSNFNQNISNWKISDKCKINNIFLKSPLEGKEQEWFGRIK